MYAVFKPDLKTFIRKFRTYYPTSASNLGQPDLHNTECLYYNIYDLVT